MVVYDAWRAQVACLMETYVWGLNVSLDQAVKRHTCLIAFSKEITCLILATIVVLAAGLGFKELKPAVRRERKCSKGLRTLDRVQGADHNALG